jgi:hypothetical protein
MTFKDEGNFKKATSLFKEGLSSDGLEIKHPVQYQALLGNLSSITNYDFNQTEVEDLYSLLVENLKSTFTLFDQGSPQERLERILNRDREELLQIKKSDPDLYNYIKDSGVGSLIPSFDDKKENIPNQKDLLPYFSELKDRMDNIEGHMGKLESILLSSNRRLEAIINGFNLERD